MTSSPEPPRERCARRGEALAWLQGELPADTAEAFGQHVQDCVPCAEFVADARRLLARLRDEARAGPQAAGRADADAPRAAGATPAAPGAARDAAERRILQRCGPELLVLQAQARRRARRGALAAAAVLLLAVTSHLGLRSWRGPDHDASPSVAAGRASSVAIAVTAAPEAYAVPAAPAIASAGAAWIAGRLGPDGRFDEASWTGPRGDTIAMHGLALLALTRSDGRPAGDARAHAADVLRGARWLLEQQSADGTIGAPDDEGDFDHAVAAVALLEAGQLTHDAGVSRGAGRAVAHLLASQLADGGWDRRAARGSNAARTAFCLQALLRAEQLEPPGIAPCDLAESIDRGRSRLAADLGGVRAPPDLDLDAVARIALGTQPPAILAAAEPAGPAGRGLGELYVASLAILAAAPAVPAAH